ncbi:hypothetical protein ABC974_18090 [Sphingomonas oligophenolica]|uniref:Uncharacterized protein n=1 Tax=Sphingomonas oligophenolica TaxID=301154 RepID=A0ABU9Y6X9_9SPHN
MPTTVVKQTPPTARGAPHPLEQVLRFPNPGEAGWKQWITYSKSEKGDEKEELYRIPGDSFSKYYEVHLYSGQGDESSDILDDTNNIVGDLGWYADLVGIRKTPQAITVFAYYFSNGDPENDEGLGGYQIGRIEHGRVKHFRCVITKETLELAVGRHFGTRRQLVAASEENATAVVDLLTSSEPQMKRDHCS